MSNVVLLFFWSVFLFPNIKIASGLPAIRVEDFLIIVVLIWSVQSGALFVWKQSFIAGYRRWLSWMSLWILVTIVLNGRYFSVSDYFEIIKVLKYFLVLVIFIKISNSSKFIHKLIKSFVVVFVLLFIFNLLNLMNFGVFNAMVMPFYAPEHHLDAIIEANNSGTAIRMIGSMGNPNNNAILWAGVTAIAIGLISARENKLFFYQAATVLSFLMCLLSQSRTTMVGLLVGLGFLLVSRIKSFSFWRVVLGCLAGALALYVFAISLNLNYLLSLWTVDLDENTSWQARLEIWQYLMDMIFDSPWIGYGPDKDFFYQRGLFAENEYILNAWRYGFVGLIFYIGWVGIPWLAAMKALKSNNLVWCKALTILAPVYFIAAMTNNPMAEPRLMLLYALLAGLSYADISKSKVE